MSSLVLSFIGINYSCYAFGSLLIACELCERAGYLFDEIDDMIGQLDWYNFPYEIRKILPFMLIMAQKPFRIECFGSIACNRETFKKVSSMEMFTNAQMNLFYKLMPFQTVNKGYSVFNVMRHFMK